MQMEQPDSPRAQSKAVEMYQNTKKPFEVYPGMTSAVMDYQNIMGFLVLLFCVVIAAPIFSADYQSGADDILRCTRHGRVSLGIAKMFAALFISGAAFVLCAAVHILVADSLFGWECTRTSIQMMYSIVTLADMNIGAFSSFCCLWTAFGSGFCELYAVSFRQMQDHCVIPGIIAGILYCAGGHFHDGAGNARYMALQHPARQRNRHSGERSLRNYGLPVFESGRAVGLDAVCHDWGLHD